LDTSAIFRGEPFYVVPGRWLRHTSPLSAG
jgi:hypothetical protein